jgi:hypothetical protein
MEVGESIQMTNGRERQPPRHQAPGGRPVFEAQGVELSQQPVRLAGLSQSRHDDIAFGSAGGL